MNKHFSIGQISKLHNISIETLRHYDRCGLLKPEYINEKTGYRYYSIKSFIKIDLIKQCKAIGLSLDEIKEIMNDYMSLESIGDILKKQNDIIDKKIVELKNIKRSIESLQGSITEALDIGINKVFIKHNKNRKLKKYDYAGRYTEEFEMNLRKSYLEIEQKYNTFNTQIVFATSFKDLVDKDEITYTKTMIKLEYSLLDYNDENVVILPEGNYLTLYFDDDYYDNKKYYNIIIDYIRENNIEVVGDFYEIYTMTRVGNNGEEKSLATIEILINK